MDIDFNYNSEIVKKTIEWLIPAILLAAFNFLGPFADFAWKEILFTWRGLAILGITILAFLFTPAYFIWIGLGIFIIFAIEKLVLYSSGLRFNKFPTIVFAGFYAMNKSHGKFSRTGGSILLESRFYEYLDKFLGSHEIQSIFPIKLEKFRPPRIIYSKHDYESFTTLTQRYALGNIGVIWGITDENGLLQKLDVVMPGATNPNDTVQFYDDVRRVISLNEISSDTKIEVLAQVLASLWGQVFCDMLNDFGQWQNSLWVAGHSKDLTLQAISKLEEINEESVLNFARFIKSRVLPILLRQEALSLGRGEKYEDALDVIFESIILNPRHPFYTDLEFATFYNNNYAYSLAAKDLSDEKLSERINVYEQKGRLQVEPNIHLFVSWLHQTDEAMVENLDLKIESWFSRLVEVYPENPFVYLYWADSLGANSKNSELAEEAEEDLDILPLEILDKKMDLIKKALQIAPELNIAGAKLAALILSASSYFDPETSEHKTRIDELKNYGPQLRKYFINTFRDRLTDNTVKKDLRD